MISTSFAYTVPEDAVHARHVNNVKYLEFLEVARQPWYHYFRGIGMLPFMANVNASYKREAFLGDHLLIQTTLDRVGQTSFVLKHVITNQHREVVLEAEAIFVAMCPETRQKISVPDELRAQIQK